MTKEEYNDIKSKIKTFKSLDAEREEFLKIIFNLVYAEQIILSEYVLKTLKSELKEIEK